MVVFPACQVSPGSVKSQDITLLTHSSHCLWGHVSSSLHVTLPVSTGESCWLQLTEKMKEWEMIRPQVERVNKVGGSDSRYQ